MSKLVCREKLIAREPYLRYGACLNTLKRALKEIGDTGILEDLLEDDVRNHQEDFSDCGWFEKAPAECEGLTVEECIRKTGEFQYREWCFRDSPYKYGVEVDCGAGLIYVFYCTED